ncbi:NYN domain-containing protein [Paraurantiacibacter namhicola]|uniref:NYN domain protein n=1 Tax=Paraurantiacibacter namhicola TaxID=645517 RepID=A0A1C7D931_9SPHN|nr:NYN domain-containing protein [Paraurantiacibacter namhicola]ANU07947.1 NYN domain protein [Paraurantiacibacter namhicola]
MSEEKLRNIALLIDADNASHRGIDPVLTVLAELGQVNIRRAYGNWAKPALSDWNKITHRYGLQPMQQFDLTKGKNATDMAMTIDAIDLLNAGKVDGFGIMSSDSDFTPLVTRLRQDGLLVYGFGAAKAPEAFRTACSRFIDVEKLIRTDAAADDAVSDDTIDPELIELLGGAWKAAHRDDEGWAKLQEVGQIAGNRSSFDVRNYGYKRLSELMRAAEGHFALDRRDNNQMYVKRLR